MDQTISRALSHGHLIDITTTGRRSGQPRRVEIVFHNLAGRLYISGMPRAGHTRAWLRNLAADPHFTFHLKGPVTADLPATARIVTDETERRAIFTEIIKVWHGQDLETMVRHSPLIEVTIEALAA
ncbi:MAG: nitroreductase/quinone reductase family protein [Chloroflexota bacterium]